MSELNDRINTASKFTGEQTGIPQKDQSQQVSIGFDWAKRLESKPVPEPIKLMAPIVPVAN